MRAIRVHAPGDPSVLQLETVADLHPEPGEVLVRLRAIGVNPVEAYVRAGAQGYAPAVPYTPGSDGAGTVEGVGDGVVGWNEGDRVYLSGSVTGTYAEGARCRPEHLHPLPDGVSFPAGAALGVPYATAYRALFDRAGAQPGETVLVHGATGGVGLAAVQLAAAHGCIVYGTGSTAEGRALVEKEGARAAFDHGDGAHFDALREATGGRGLDVIVEMLANVNLGRDLDVLAPRGRVVVVGSRGAVEVVPRALMGRDADVRGMSLKNASGDDLARIHAALGAGLRNGTLRPTIARTFALADAADAHRALMAGGATGKIVLVP